MRAKKEKFFLFFDTETAPFDGKREEYKPYIYGAQLYNVGDTSEAVGDFHFCYSAAEFVDFLNTLPADTIAYAHNGGKFDFIFLRDFFNSGSLVIINGRIAKVNIGDIELRDSFLLFPQGLASYKKDDFDYSLLETNESFSKNIEKVKQYLKHDVEYLAKITLHFIAVFGCELTLPASCFKFWKKQNKIKKSDIRTDNGNYDALFRSFYFGGRCEVFKSGELGALTCYDINSAYPYAMLSRHPFGYAYDITDESDLVGQSFVTCTGYACGCFPFKDAKGNLTFPRDYVKRTYNVTGWEYFTAIKLKLFNGTVDRVYNHTRTVNFSRYVEHFYLMKRESAKGSLDYIVAKLALNSLYGKFAQNPNKFKSFLIGEDVGADSITYEGKEYNVIDILGNNKLMYARDLDDSEKHYINVATAASITGKQRAYLMENLVKSKGVAYCDTDSIFCESLNAEAIQDDIQLGAWGVDGDFDRMTIYGKKLYCAHSKSGSYKIASKGARLTSDDFILIKNRGKVNYKSYTPCMKIKGETQCVYVNRDIRRTSSVFVNDLTKFE